MINAFPFLTVFAVLEILFSLDPTFTAWERKWKQWQQRLGEGLQTGLPVDNEALFWIQSLPASSYLAFTTLYNNQLILFLTTLSPSPLYWPSHC